MTSPSSQPSRMKRLAVIALISIGLAATARVIIDAATQPKSKLPHTTTIAHQDVHVSDSPTASYGIGAEYGGEEGATGMLPGDMMGSMGMEMMSPGPVAVSHRIRSDDLEGIAKELRDAFGERIKIAAHPEQKTLLVTTDSGTQSEVGAVIRFLERQRGVTADQLDAMYSAPYPGMMMGEGSTSFGPGMDAGRLAADPFGTRRSNPLQPAAPEKTVKVYSLQHVNASEMADVLQVVVEPPGKYQVVPQQNTIIVNADETTQQVVEALLLRLDVAGQTPPQRKTGSTENSITVEIPAAGISEGYSFEMGTLRGDSGDGMSSKPTSARKLQVDSAVKKMNDAKDDSQKQTARTELRNLLEEIFAEDMQSRQQILQQIESRAQKLRQQYRNREDVKDEIIELQLKVLEQDASGLGFPEISQPTNPNTPISMPGPTRLPTTSQRGQNDSIPPAAQNAQPLVTGPGPGVLPQPNVLNNVDRSLGSVDSTVRDYYQLRDRIEQATTPELLAEAKRIYELKLTLLAAERQKAEAELAAAEEQAKLKRRLNEKGYAPNSELSQAELALKQAQIEVERATALLAAYQKLPQPDELKFERTLAELKQSDPTLVSELTKKGHFVESPDGALYAYVNANIPNGPSMLIVVDAATGRRLFDEEYANVIGALIFNADGISSKEGDGEVTLRLPQRAIDERQAELRPTQQAAASESPKPLPNRDWTMAEFQQANPDLVKQLAARGHFVKSPDEKLFAYAELTDRVHFGMYGGIGAEHRHRSSIVTLLESATGKRISRVEFSELHGPLEFTDEGVATRSGKGAPELLIPCDPETGQLGAPPTDPNAAESKDPMQWRKPRNRTEYEKALLGLQGHWRTVAAIGEGGIQYQVRRGNLYQQEAPDAQLDQLDLQVVIDGHDVAISYFGDDRARRTAKAFLTLEMLEFMPTPMLTIQIDGVPLETGPSFSSQFSPNQTQLTLQKHGEDFLSDQSYVVELQSLTLERDLRSPQPAVSPESSLGALQGHWAVANALQVVDGLQVPFDEYDARKLGGSETLIFEGNVIRRRVERINQTGPPVSAFNEPWGFAVVNESTTPMQIDIVNPNDGDTPVAVGLFELDGDTLKIALGHESDTNGTTGLARPKDLGPGPGVLYFECRRQKTPSVLPLPAVDPASIVDPLSGVESDLDRLQGDWTMLAETAFEYDKMLHLHDPEEVFQHGGKAGFEIDKGILSQFLTVPDTIEEAGSADPSTPQIRSWRTVWGQMTLHENLSPKEFDIRLPNDAEGRSVRGVYELEGDRWKVAIGYDAASGALTFPRPKAVLPGKGVLYFECRRGTVDSQPVASPVKPDTESN